MILYIGNKQHSANKNVTGIDTLGKLLEIEGYKIKSISAIRNRFFRLISMIFTTLKLHKKIKFVLIDTFSTKNFYYAYIISQLCRFFKIKYIPILRGGNLPFRLDKSPKMSKLLFANSYRNIAPSNYLKSEFDKRGFESVFIPNVLEIEKYNFLERGFSTPKLLYVRAFASIYNPEMAIKVLNEVKKEYPEAILCMVGPVKDNSFNSCKALVSKLGMESSVEFTGMLPKEKWHKKSEAYNIFINTTNIDNTPVSVMEAMALGLPVISTNVGGVPFLIENNKTGILVDKNDINAMAKAIDVICKNEKKANSLATNAREQVEKFNWNNVKQLWHNILQ